MKKIIMSILVSCLIVTTSHGQIYTWPGPVNFPVNTNICDNTPMKLVFYEDFSDTSIPPGKLITYTSWDAMPKVLLPGDTITQDHDNWDGSRLAGGASDIPNSWNCVYRDQNIIVSNGTCKLQVKHESVDWHCDTCSANATRYYSGAMIATPYYWNNQRNYYNSGMFEVRMKMANFYKAHTTLWTWFGTYGGVNEIDMAEAYGPL